MNNISKHGRNQLNMYAHDMVMNVYEKLRVRIAASGLTGNNLRGYFWQSMSNEYKLHYNRGANKIFTNSVDIHNPDLEDHYPEVDNTLLQEEQYHEQRQQYYDMVRFVVYMLFKYLETKHEPKAVYLYKKHFCWGYSYAKLAHVAKRTEAWVSMQIKPIKRDVQTNFKDYLMKHITVQ